VTLRKRSWPNLMLLSGICFTELRKAAVNLRISALGSGFEPATYELRMKSAKRGQLWPEYCNATWGGVGGGG
jgi:hypothetical protein